MHPRRDSFLAVLLPVLAGIAVISVFVASYRYTSRTHGEERFVVYWAGMRAWLLNGVSPYSHSTEIYIQEVSVRSGDPNAKVTYPLYGGFFFLPYAAIPNYALAQALWITTLGIALLITALLCLRLSGWRTTTGLLALYLFLCVSGYPNISLVINGNATVLAVMFLVGALDAIRIQRDTTAGVLLALSTIQPMVGLVALIFIAWWAFAHRRWLVLLWFFGLVVALSAVGAFFVPTWVLQWMRNLLKYATYYSPATPRAAFQNWWPGVGRQAGLLFTAILLISLLSEWLAAQARELRWFLWTVGMTFIVAQWVGIPAGMENYVLFLLPLATFASILEERGGKKTRGVIALILLIYYTGSWVIYLRATPEQLRAAMLFLPPLMLLVLIYYVRWWAIHPPPLLEETFQGR